MTRFVLGHPFGNVNVRHALRALFEAEMLERFVTTIDADHLRFPRHLPTSISKELERRRYGEIPPAFISSRLFPEVLRLFAHRLPAGTPGVTALPDTDDVWRSVDRRMSLLVGTNHGLWKGVYAYEDGAYHTFKAAPLACKVYELPIGYWRRKHFLLEEERQLNPGWASTLNVISEPEAKLARKDAELELASHIVVPSNFVFDTLPPSLQTKASVVCYGCPEPASPDQVFLPSGPKLKVLFCGSLGQRKGLSYFFDAIRVLRPFLDVTVIGRRDSVNENLDIELQGVTWYPSLPRTEVLEVMRAHDVFLFPTLFEGRALVVLEAMSQGMVVITTENAGVGDLIVHGESGYIVPMRTVEPIVAILEDLMASPDRRREVQLSALAAAASANWRVYRERLLEVLEGAIERTNSSSVLSS